MFDTHAARLPTLTVVILILLDDLLPLINNAHGPPQAQRKASEPTRGALALGAHDDDAALVENCHQVDLIALFYQGSVVDMRAKGEKHPVSAQAPAQRPGGAGRCRVAHSHSGAGEIRPGEGGLAAHSSVVDPPAHAGAARRGAAPAPRSSVRHRNVCGSCSLAYLIRSCQDRLAVRKTVLAAANKATAMRSRWTPGPELMQHERARAMLPANLRDPDRPWRARMQAKDQAAAKTAAGAAPKAAHEEVDEQVGATAGQLQLKECSNADGTRACTWREQLAGTASAAAPR